MEILEKLTPAEIKTLRSWLSIDAFNSQQELGQLFDTLTEYLHELHIIPSREQLHETLFRGQPFDDQRLRLLCSYLVKKIENYWVWCEFQARPADHAALLLSAYRRRRLPRHFSKTLRSRRQQLETQPLRHAEHYWAQYQLEQEHYLWESSAGRTREHNLQALDDALLGALLGMKLRQACLAIAHQAVYNTQYSIGLIEPLLEEAAKPQYDQMPAVAVYRDGFLVLSHPERHDYFQNFKQGLFSHIAHFPKSEMRDLFLLAINFCIRQINANRPDYQVEALDLYKKGLETELLLENGQLSRFAYNNIVGIALRTEELTWVEGFVATYRHRLSADHRDTTYYLSAARIAFARGHYPDALRHLQRADYDDLINNMVAKTLQLKIYYELREFGLLDSHLRTMRTYLRRSRQMSYHQRNYDNIIRYTLKLINLPPYDKTGRAALRQEINATEPLTEKEWLLEKLESK